MQAAYSCCRYALFLILFSCAAAFPAAPVDAQDTGAKVDSDRTGYLVRVALPIDSQVSTNVRNTLMRIAEKSERFVRPEDRPVVVLEFDTAGGKTGRGSELEACMALARYLNDPGLNRLETVAYLPAGRDTTDEEREAGGQLKGHAVLVAIAANQLALEPASAIGMAGIDEPQISPLVTEIYRSIASQRLTLPVPVVMSMLDKERQLYRVITKTQGVVYVDANERLKLEESLESKDTRTVSKQGEMAWLTASELEEYRLTQLHPASRTDLARLLDIAPNTLEGNPAEGKNWKAVQVDLPPFIDRGTTTWIVRELSRRISKKQTNLVIFNFNGNEGDLDACLRLAQHIVDYDPNEIRTVAFVRDSARGPVGLAALSCSQLIMAPNSELGGTNEDEPQPEMSAEERANLKPLLQGLAEKKQTDWSMMMAIVDPQLSVSRFRHRESGQIRLLCNEELESLRDLEKWAPMGPVSVDSGVSAETAEQLFLARTIAEDMGQIQTFYQLDGVPTQLAPSASDRWLEQFAGFLSSPFIAPMLLFGAMFFFSTEMSAPGLGLPGFLSTVCFILFFWSQALGGNADWLEVLLFIVGVIFIGMELFVLPGFGIFGIGGLLMVITSVVLASQSFLIPRTSEELAQIPYSLLPVVGAGLGVVAGAYALRKILPNSPYLKRMMLEPKKRIETGLEGDRDPEAIVDWSHLAGQTGETITKLYPAGKARIGGQIYDVISSGQLVDKGEKIEVIEAIGNRIVVKPLQSTEA